MIYAVIFEDAPNLGSDPRHQHMAAHLAFLAENAASIKIAGPLTEASGDPAGGLWLVDAETPEAVDSLVRADPFWPTGLRRSVRILAWHQVFAGGKRRI
ncbi:MAG TPA: YciI family protein [Stellaceae bacterium]|nr:YciI family protein [Stellaceae bacterium]